MFTRGTGYAVVNLLPQQGSGGYSHTRQEKQTLRNLEVNTKLLKGTGADELSVMKETRQCHL